MSVYSFRKQVGGKMNSFQVVKSIIKLETNKWGYLPKYHNHFICPDILSSKLKGFGHSNLYSIYLQVEISYIQ